MYNVLMLEGLTAIFPQVPTYRLCVVTGLGTDSSMSASPYMLDNQLIISADTDHAIRNSSPVPTLRALRRGSHREHRSY